MLSWIIQQVAISLVIIVLIHSIYNFLQLNLTTPKVRDLVNKPSKKYEEIYNTFKKTEKINIVNDKNDENSENMMKSELQNYLKELSSENHKKHTNAKNDMKDMESPKDDNIELQAASFSDNFTPAYQTF